MIVPNDKIVPQTSQCSHHHDIANFGVPVQLLVRENVETWKCKYAFKLLF